MTVRRLAFGAAAFCLLGTLVSSSAAGDATAAVDDVAGESQLLS